ATGADGGRDRRGVRQRLLDRGLAPERPAACASTPADRARRGGGNSGRARDRPRPVPELPLPARLLLHPALRRAACRLAAGGSGLLPARHLLGALVPSGAGRGLALQLRALPVVATGWPHVVDRPPGAPEPADARTRRL